MSNVSGTVLFYVSDMAGIPFFGGGVEAEVVENKTAMRGWLVMRFSAALERIITINRRQQIDVELFFFTLQGLIGQGGRFQL